MSLKDKFKTEPCYNWSDIKLELALRLGLDTANFDIQYWDAFLYTVLYGEIHNDTAVYLFKYELSDDTASYVLGDSKDEEAKLKLIPVWNEVVEELSPENEGILVRFWW